MKIIKNRIYNILGNNQRKEQAGFIDHIFSINQLTERTNKYRIELNLFFIEFNKAFDSIRHSFLRQALDKQGVPKNKLKISLRSNVKLP